jgi:Holliday junction resolvase RusA-like endonuclease
VIQSRLIPLPPFGKARPRVTRNGTYMPHEYERAKGQLSMLFGPVEAAGAVRLTVHALHALPRSWSQKKRAMLVNTPRIGKPDADNVCGAVMDALFPDNDTRVVELVYKSVYSHESGLFIQIEEIV